MLGATGGTGRAIIGEARRQGHGVTALVRSKAKAGVLADAELVAVISALGTLVSPPREVTRLSTATAALIGAMQRQGARRLVCITGMGAGDSRGHGGGMFDRLVMPLLLRQVPVDKNRQEALVRAGGPDRVLGRPTVLNTRTAQGSVRALTDLNGFGGGTIVRADVARFVVQQLTDDRWLNSAPLITW